MNPQTSRFIWALLFGVGLAALTGAAKQKPPPSTEGEEFFVISSVDPKKRQLILKRPTEVTEVMQVTENTAHLDEQGKVIPFKDLRTGDTVYVLSVSKAAGPRVALRIRKGPMTSEELRRRYLGFQ